MSGAVVPFSGLLRLPVYFFFPANVLPTFLSRFCRCPNLVAGVRTIRLVFRDKCLFLVTGLPQYSLRDSS